MSEELEKLIKKGQKNKQGKPSRNNLSFFIHAGYIAAILLFSFLSFVIGSEFSKEKSVANQTTASDDSVLIQGDNNVVSKTGSQFVRDWGDLPASSRKEIRVLVFAHFPSAIGKSTKAKWEQVAEWLRVEHSISVTNVRDIVRTKRNGEMPRQIATFLDVAERAMREVRIADRSDLLATWLVPPKSRVDERTEQWADMILEEVRSGYGESWVAKVQERFLFLMG